jgi:hypothetical protein
LRRCGTAALEIGPNREHGQFEFQGGLLHSQRALLIVLAFVLAAAGRPRKIPPRTRSWITST